MFDTAEEKAALQQAIEEATSGLKAKNTELLAELKKARKNAEITPEQYAEVEAERDKAQAEAQAAAKAAKDAAKLAEAQAKQLQAETAFTQKLLVDNGLVAELTKHGVTNPVHLKAAQALLRGGVQIVTEGENRIAKVGDKDLAAFVKEWAAGDEGKHFVAAPAHAGGGAPGSGGTKPEAKQLSRKDFDAAAPAEQMKFIREGGKVVD